jgi:hypothetical protein
MRAERVKQMLLAAGDHAIFIEGENLALLEDLLDADELDKLKKSKAAFVDSVKEGKAAAKAKAKASARRDALAPIEGGDPTAASSGAPAAPRLHVPIAHSVPEADDTTLEAWKAFLPQVRGCTLTLDVVWHNRFVVSYPKTTPPYSKSAVFGPESRTGFTLKQAFLVCARWAWQEHLTQGGEPSPFNLDDDLD